MGIDNYFKGGVHMDVTFLFIIIQVYALGALALGFINSPLSLARLSKSVRVVFIIPTLMIFVVMYSFYFKLQSIAIMWKGIPVLESDIWIFSGIVSLFALLVYLPNNFGLKTNHEEVIQEYLSRNKTK